jgi:tetratricopeptide (TPR) repeat protein
VNLHFLNKFSAPAIVLLALWTGGCAHDIWVNDAELRPAWANRAPEPEQGRVFFVGRSPVMNIADERQGVSTAIDDAIYQIAKTTGAKIKGQASIGGEPHPEIQVQIEIGGTIAGLRQEALYCQRGYLHNEAAKANRRLQYYVLVSVPETELARLETESRNATGKSLDNLLAEANAAIHASAYAKGRDILKSAVSLYPTAPTAWTALADVQEKLQDWDGAFNAWDSLRRLADDANTRSFAQAALNRVNDERVIVRLTQAEQIAQAGRYSDALNLLTEAASLKPSARVFERVRNRYFEFLGRRFEQEIKAAMTTHQWTTLAVANFAGDSEAEGVSIRDRIYSALGGIGGTKPQILFLSQSAIAGLRQGRFDTLPEPEQREIKEIKVDAIVFGTIGKQLDGYLFDVSHQQTLPLLSVNPLGSIPGYPSNTEAWLRLPAKNSTSRGLRVEIWTDKTSYAVGSEVEFRLRSNRDCHVMLLDLQTSGGLYVLFPNSFQRENFVQANRIYTIPGASAPFSINVSGPTGVEGVKAIAAIKPLPLATLTGSQTFVAARTPSMQNELCEQIQSAVKGFGDDDWDITEWTFEIAK